jgi:hypothetical protein
MIGTSILSPMVMVMVMMMVMMRAVGVRPLSNLHARLMKRWQQSPVPESNISSVPSFCCVCRHFECVEDPSTPL